MASGSGQVNQSKSGIAPFDSYVANFAQPAGEPRKTTMNNDSGSEADSPVAFIQRETGGVGAGSTIPH